MRRLLLGALVVVVIGCLSGGAEAQDAEELFRKVSPSVVVVRAKGRAVDGTRGLLTYSEIGSGVLISADGKVMTAAHVVHAMDEVLVEFLGGELVPARVVASEPAADLSLLQLSHIPNGAQPARIGDSDKVRVGDIVLSMAGIAIKSEADLPKIRATIGEMSPGDPFKASVLRAGTVIELTGKAP
jgi:serine protease Do